MSLFPISTVSYSRKISVEVPCNPVIPDIHRPDRLLNFGVIYGREQSAVSGQTFVGQISVIGPGT